jgi:hypothetical protein
MSSQRPLRANSLHPEYFDAPAAEADKLGCFTIVIDGQAPRRAFDAWERYRRSPAPWGQGPITATAFDPAFRIILAAARECRLFGLTPKLKRDTPGAPEPWLERYTIRDGRGLDVDIDAPGVRDDLEAWWWLVRHAQPVFTCDATALDAPTLFSIGSGPMFTGVGGKLASEAHARKRAERPGTVSLLPYGSDGVFGLIVVAAPGLAGDLAREAVLRQPLSEKVRAVRATLRSGFLSSMEAIDYWYVKVTPQRFEKTLVATLKAGEEKPQAALVALRALIAAEGVAIAEGRGPTERTEEVELAENLAKAADPVGDATIELALRAVQAVSAAGVCERTEWAGEEARFAFRAEIEGLQKRLHAALRTRRTRARAPNAVAPAPRRPLGRPVNWRTSWLHLMLDDAVALIGAAREETGAVPLILMEDHSFRELATDWDAIEALSTIKGQPFEERDGGWLHLNSGQQVLLWWPGISPRPFISEEGDGPMIVSWGHAELGLFGATRTRVLRSTFSYPTGRELKRPKFAGAGPWRDVNWTAFREKTKAIRKLLVGTLGGVAPVDLRDTVTLPVAAASARSGKRAIIGQGINIKATLPK